MDNVVKSAARVLEVLEYFSERQSASSAEEVRRTLGYPQSSTSILLRSLASLGYLNYEPLNRTFRPTIRVALLGAWLVEEIDEDRNPTKMMRSLSEATGDMIILGTEHGLEAVYLKRSEEHTSELQSLMRISYAVFCLKKKKNTKTNLTTKRRV